jgi:hypothetical protein
VGAVILDLELLKPFRVAAVASDWLERAGAPGTVWLEYAYSKHHPVLQYLPMKLAEWIGENMQEELGFPDREDPRKWSVSELNNILHRHVVSDRNCCALHTFGRLEWESRSELYRGVMRARCYPFNIPGRRFHNMNVQVYWATVIPYLSHTHPWFMAQLYAMLAGRCADCAPVSFRLGRPLCRAS